MKRLDPRSLTRAPALAASALAVLAAACGGGADENTVPDIQASDLTPLRAGVLMADGAGGAPDATGSIAISRGPSGGIYVALGSDFKQEMGPGDTQLILAKTADNVQAQRDADPASASAAVGVVPNGFQGFAAYKVPAGVDVSAFSYVIVWCPTAGVNFGAARLGEDVTPNLSTVRQGNFISDGAGGAPNASGVIQVVRDDAGKLALMLGDDFAQEMGPGDTQLILARTDANVQAQRDADATSVSAAVGTIPNGGSGAMHFELPAGLDLDAFDYAIVWCPTAGVNFGAAKLPLRSGSFTADGAGGAPDARGGVAFERDAEGALTVVLGADFAQEMGPGDTQLILARTDGNVNEQRSADAASTSPAIGVVPNGRTGGLSFTLPAGVDADAFDYAIIWCPTAGVNFGAARLN
jgi:hypothetical protein